MKAKDMFEQLGYEQINSVITVGNDQRGYFDLELVRFQKYDDTGFYGSTYIYFDTTYQKTFQKFDDNRTALPITINELKAIQKQIEELRWE